MLLDIALYKWHSRLLWAQSLIARHSVRIFEVSIGTLLHEPLAKLCIPESKSEVEGRLAKAILSVKVCASAMKCLADVFLIVLSRNHDERVPGLIDVVRVYRA